MPRFQFLSRLCELYSSEFVIWWIDGRIREKRPVKPGEEARRLELRHKTIAEGTINQP